MYSSSPPSSDPHDPFSNSHAPAEYNDNDSEQDYRNNRDTYGSDSSNINDDDRYYEQSGGYDLYGRECRLIHVAPLRY